MPSIVNSSNVIPRFLGAGDFTYRTDRVPVHCWAQGSRLRDEDGETYVDAEAANGTVGLGYDSSLLEEAVATTGALPALPSFCESRLRLEVARELERLVCSAVGSPGRISFELGGAQGIELAMKIVAANRDGTHVACMQGGYHGRSPYTARLSASARYRVLLSSGADEVVRLPYPDCEQCPLGLARNDCRGACAAYARSYGSEQSGLLPGHVSALVIEPVLNAGGMALPDGAALRETVAHFRSLGALIVVDEVFTGLFRTGPRFGFELHGIDPDVVVLSKALTNGAGALSAVWAREPLLAQEHFAPGTHSSTYAGTPLMLGVAKAVMARYADGPAWTARAALLQERLGAIVTSLARDFPATVRSGYALGGLARLLLTGPVAGAVRAAALHPPAGPVDGVRGVLVASTGMAPNVVALHPPLTIDDTDLELVQRHLRSALQAVEAAR